jgi:hypothetical protein
MLPARKRKNFWLRVGSAGILFIVLAYGLNEIYSVPTVTPLAFAYWGFYIVVCGMFVYIGLASSVKQAIYCSACACAMQHIAFDLCLIYRAFGGKIDIVLVAIYIVVYALFYVFFACNLTENGLFVFHRNALFPIVTIIILVWILSIIEVGFSVVVPGGTSYRIIYRMIDALCCFYVLWVQVNQKNKISLKYELDTVNYLLDQQKKQYQITSEIIGDINRKCHDLKYQIRALRRMSEGNEREEFLNVLESDIMIYDTVIKTGNQALDIVLMEKGLFCKNHNIQWTCMADGFQLDFMKNEDIYAIFGNAFDNAISAVQKVEEDKRVIGVKMINQNNLLTIQIQNYFNGELEFVDGLPKTTQENKRMHGYGMKSIRYTAEKYFGTITVNTESDIFMLQILIPIPS